MVPNPRHAHTAWALLFALVFVAALLAARSSPPADAAPRSGTAPPPAPILSPAEALTAFRLAPGFRISLAAAEPMVEAPVAMSFDEDGRAWVVEMRGYMPDVEGSNELEPNGRIVILTDADHDGIFDTRTVFLEHLVLPRAVMPCFGGALIIAPPDLLFAKDTTGDGVADERRVLTSGLGGIESPEHAPNGLLYGVDNWVHLSQADAEYRFDGASLRPRTTPAHGQWGLTQDLAGRLYYSPNPEALRGDLFPKHYASRNPTQREPAGINRLVSPEQSVWPAIPTPAVNRGYMNGILRPDGRLAAHTAACAPLLYFEPALRDCQGDAFVCEPAAYLLRRLHLTEGPGGPIASNAYDRAEFLTSTDTRFRPVNTCTGPDGALYLVDMHRGILQHKKFITPYLKDQTARLGIQGPLNMGRIYRITSTGQPALTPARPLSRATTSELVGLLSHPGAWWRLTAQRLLVERRDPAAAALLRPLLTSTSAAARIHALWTLDGLTTLTREDALAALDDPDPAVRTQALRVCERFAADPQVQARITALATQPGTSVQAVLSLGECPQAARLTGITAAIDARGDDSIVRSAALSSLTGLEVPLLRTALTKDWATSLAWRAMASDLTDGALRSSDAQTRTDLVELLAAAPPDRAALLLSRLARAQQLDRDKPKTIALTREPAGWAALTTGPLAEAARASDTYLAWPGRARPAAAKTVRPLTPDEQRLFDSGKGLFATCSGCHGAEGAGTPGQIPALVGSARVQGPAQRVIPILLHGLQPATIPGGPPPTLMPPVPFDDEESIASVLTYIRRAWGNTGDPISPDQVRQVRDRTDDRSKPWTVEELDAIP